MSIEIPQIVDNDAGEITVMLNGKEIRGWTYATSLESGWKMKMAREFVEGWYQAMKSAPTNPGERE